MNTDTDGDEEQLKLQRASSDLIKEFKQSLPRLLWKSSDSVRRLIRNSKTKHLISLLEPFQEEPQLLDRHLAEMISPLVEAFLSFLTRYVNGYQKINEHSVISDVSPLPRAVCSILYTFCKIRGYKIVVRFFSTKPQLLDPILSAFELWNDASDDRNSERKSAKEIFRHANLPDLVTKVELFSEDNSTDYSMSGTTWEEKYIMLLWIYHLAGVPFDLTSLSSTVLATPSAACVAPFPLPHGCPMIVRRLVIVACKYLGEAGRERVAAVQLLTRLALLDDWHKIGLHRHIIDWALLYVAGSNEKIKIQPNYNCMSLISFLANFVSQATSALLQPFLSDLIDLAQVIQAAHNPSPAMMKLVIKLHRNLALQSLDFRNQAVELATTHLIDQLSANNTVIRLAASKALARIVFRLDQDMVADLVGHLLAGLERDLSSQKSKADERSPLEQLNFSKGQFGMSAYHLESVNASKWHGLIMALSHLIYQHSIPGPSLVAAMEKLIIALHFNQTNSLGSLIGSNVRDAACFGFWALARKYSTLEVNQFSIQNGFSFQALADELVVTALLDPVGNVRRAASAALQEMIGRHPDKIDCGQDLELVRAVDYHAVSSKTKATKAAMSVIDIGNNYWACLLQGLFSWRGARFEDNGSRQRNVDENQRNAAILISTIAVQHRSTLFTMIPAIRHELKTTKFSKLAERRGLVYALAGVISEFGNLLNRLLPLQGNSANEQQILQLHGTQIAQLCSVLDIGIGAPPNTLSQRVRQIEAVFFGQLGHYLRLRISVAPIETLQDPSICLRKLSQSLKSLDEKTATINGRAIREILLLPEAQNEANNENFEFLTDWIEKLSSAKGSARFGYLAALSGAVLLPNLPKVTYRKILDALVTETTHQNMTVELRAYSIDLMHNDLVRFNVCTPAMANAFEDCLNDYTIDKQKGDVGQHVRKAAISAIDLAISRNLISNKRQLVRMTGKICGLAMDKIGGVRLQAITFLKRCQEINGLAVADLLSNDIPEIPRLTGADMDNTTHVPLFDAISTSQEIPLIDLKYETRNFEKILALTQLEWANSAVLEAFAVTAGSECEGLYDSRTALINHSDRLSDSDLRSLWVNVVKILQDHPDDRVLIPTMEMIDFLFESGITLRLEQDGFGCWDQLFDLVNKRRFKSTNIRKLKAAIQVYCNLAQFGNSKGKIKAVSELCKMLQHPYPIVSSIHANVTDISSLLHPLSAA